ncbi:MAG TPA: hypothetical protein DCZ71_05670 [Ruminococcus sp.]|nr:hypothetical protein [Ruminococcus sp.]
MKKIISLTLCGILTAAALMFAAVMTGADEMTGSVTYTLRDMLSLQDFLLAKPTDEDLSGRPYDINNDGRWDVFDFCMMKRAYLDQQEKTGDTLVVYFSRTGNTEKIADYLTELTGADSYVIEAAVPYTDEDIAYNNSSCRANQEQNDKTVRPVIADPVTSIDPYDVIFLGYPIWWGQEPRIIDTFLESYDFSDKTVIPFCTSASSGIGTSENNIKNLVPIGELLEGKRFSAASSEEDVAVWLDTLGSIQKNEETRISIEVNGHTLTALLEDNSSAQALEELLESGPLMIGMNDYGSFEKVGTLPETLPRNDEQITTAAGDLILYQGNQITIYYDENTWNFTRLGRLENITQTQLREILGDGSITATFSLTG